MVALKKFLTLPEAINFLEKRETNPPKGERGDYLIFEQFGRFIVYSMD